MKYPGSRNYVSVVNTTCRKLNEKELIDIHNMIYGTVKAFKYTMKKLINEVLVKKYFVNTHFARQQVPGFHNLYGSVFPIVMLFRASCVGVRPFLKPKSNERLMPLFTLVTGCEINFLIYLIVNRGMHWQ